MRSAPGSSSPVAARLQHRSTSVGLSAAVLGVTLGALLGGGPARAQVEPPPSDPPAAVEGEAAAEVAPPAAEPAPTAPPAAPLAPPAPASDTTSGRPNVVGADDGGLCPEGRLCLQTPDVAVWPKVALRTGYEFVQGDPQVLFVGHNDGFFVDQARLGLEGTWGGQLGFRLILEAASLLPGADANDPVRGMLAAARDAYVAWQPMQWFFVSVGQQYMPADYEGSILGGTELIFARRSVATSGVRPGHGFAVDGLTPGRQIGVVLGSGDGASVGPVSLEYRLGVSNGNGQNVLGNDNKLPAVFARVGAGFQEYVQIGVGAGWNPRTVGILPNEFQETDLLVYGDARLDAFGFHVLTQGLWRRTSFDTLVPDPNNPLGADTGFGMTSWIVVDEPFGIPLFRIKPGYRISYYDPSSAFPDDQLLENAVAARYDAPFPFPVAFIADFTLLTEMGAGVRDLDNARFALLAQVNL